MKLLAFIFEQLSYRLLIIDKIVKKECFFLALKLSYVVFIMLINVEMPTIVGISTFMSRIKFMPSCVEHGTRLINSRS